LPLDGFQFTLNYPSNYINAAGTSKYLTRGFVRVEEALDPGKTDFKFLLRFGACPSISSKILLVDELNNSVS
jgi:hypothetical protein